MQPTTPNFNFSRQAGPSSPPESPTTSTFAFGKSSPSSRRHGVQNFSRPLPRQNGNIRPHGQGHHFSYNPSVRPEDLSPRSSTPSSESSSSPPRSLSSSAAEPEHTTLLRTYTRVVAEGNFTVEEIRESDLEDLDSDDEDIIIRPDHYEDAESDQARSVKASNDLDARMLAGFQNLGCGNGFNDLDRGRDAWYQEKRAEKRRKRLSSGSIQKRTLSQSIGSDTDDEDLQPVQFDANEAGSSARRLRRKVAGERTSLIFDDPPPRIPELEEPESCEEVVEASDIEEGQGVDRELPYYVQDTMDVDSSDEE